MNCQTSKRLALAAKTWMIVLAVAVVATPVTRAQDEATRKLWDTAFINDARKQTVSKRAVVKRSYRVATPNVPTASVSGDTVVGVTVWRLRQSKSGAAGERLIVHHEDGGSSEWAPERVRADTKFAEGDRVRLSFEAARAGYLYVIDRELYADGTQGEPHLIFPTTRTRGGNNEVKPGKVIEIPSQDDKPPYFTLRHGQANHVGESLTVLVTPAPIADLQIGAQAQKVSAEQVAEWEKSWGAQVGRLEMENTAGKAWTKAEKDAATDSTRALGASDPAPQTLYYRPGAKSTEPVLVKVQLQYAAPGSRARKRR